MNSLFYTNSFLFLGYLKLSIATTLHIKTSTEQLQFPYDVHFTTNVTIQQYRNYYSLMEHCNFQNSGTCFITVICFQTLHLYSTVNKTTGITTPSKDYTENFTYLYHNIGRISSHTYKNLATTRPTLSTHKHFQAPTL